MIALYNGLGGGAAATIAAVELLRAAEHGPSERILGVVGALIGCIAFSGSLLAFAKLSGWVKFGNWFSNRQTAYVAMMAMVLMLGFLLAFSNTAHPVLLLLFFGLAILFGVFMTSPIAAADMPVLISLYNAAAGLAVAFEGFVLGNAAMMVAGTLVCAAGALLTRLMAKSVNRRLSEILYSGFGIPHETTEVATQYGHVNEVDAFDAAVSMAFAEQVLIVPGYGMAVAQAQHKVQELTQLLEERGVSVQFAIHPVAGRMPGHMNVLLAEAGVAYEKILDLNDINSEMSKIDVALVIGANDIVNLSARTDKRSPLHGMPILNVDEANSVIVLKRGDGQGYAGMDNPLLQHGKARVHFGDARESVQEMISAIKSLD
ncbi:UNVERIFIED_CONTAM: hypothetical protein GTU68_006068 [Idotea baltica]|nr:hypothetical protein [Idotea baltica]